MSGRKSRNTLVTVVFAAAAMLASVPGARAGEGVLVESIPAGVDHAGALAAAKDALKYREWKIVGEDADSVSATISRGTVDAKIRIQASGARLVYVESATGGTRRFDYAGKVVWSIHSTPSRWIEYLRSDTTERLAALVAAPGEARSADVGPQAAGTTATAVATPAPAPARSSVQRLQELKDMLDRGLITGDEYARKKDEILKAL